MTDRVLPDLMPISNVTAFDDTIENAVGIERPPPESAGVKASTLASLGAIGTQNFFPPQVRRRLVVVLTDGESRPFDASYVARALATGPGIRLVLVHIWSPHEQIFGHEGKAEAGYHVDPASGQALAALASASHGTAVGEHNLGAAARAAAAALGKGPSTLHGRIERTRTLAPYVTLSALVPLAVILFGRGLLRLLAFRRPRVTAKTPSAAA
jgi:hypothetical protein